MRLILVTAIPALLAVAAWNGWVAGHIVPEANAVQVWGVIWIALFCAVHRPFTIDSVTVTRYLLDTKGGSNPPPDGATMDVLTAAADEMVGDVAGDACITVEHEQLIGCIPSGPAKATGEVINGIPLMRSGSYFMLHKQNDVVACIFFSPDGGHVLWVDQSMRGQGVAAQMVANGIWCAWVTGAGNNGRVNQWGYRAPDQFSEGGRKAWQAGVRLFKSWL